MHIYIDSLEFYDDSNFGITPKSVTENKERLRLYKRSRIPILLNLPERFSSITALAANRMFFIICMLRIL
jgi:hypothetical protein